MALGIYKKGQGKYTRLGSAFGFAAIVAFGCYRLYVKLDANLPESQTGMWIKIMVPAGLLVGLCALIFWLMNKPSVADFMISAEGEIKKVSWSSRKEVAVSTFIVIVVVIITAILLGATDVGFEVFFREILGL